MLLLFSITLLIIRKNPEKYYRQIISIGQNEGMTNTYRNEEYGFQLDYPKSWKVNNPRLPLSENYSTLLYFQITDTCNENNICGRSTSDHSLSISIRDSEDIHEFLTNYLPNEDLHYTKLKNTHVNTYISDVWFGIDSIGAEAFLILDDDHALEFYAENKEALKYLQKIVESVQTLQ